jgi:excisionase family DNA binding protein
VKLKEYTIKQASEILEVSTSTIRRRIKSGEYVAEKKNSPYGEQYFIPAKEIDQAVMENESVNISQINKPVDKDEFVNALIEATEDKHRSLFESVAKNIVDKIEQQNEKIEGYKEELDELKGQNSNFNKQSKKDAEKIINKLDNQQKIIEQQSKMIQQLQKEKDKSLLDKIKKIFGL